MESLPTDWDYITDRSSNNYVASVYCDATLHFGELDESAGSLNGHLETEKTIGLYRCLDQPSEPSACEYDKQSGPIESWDGADAFDYVGVDVYPPADEDAHGYHYLAGIDLDMSGEYPSHLVLVATYDDD